MNLPQSIKVLTYCGYSIFDNSIKHNIKSYLDLMKASLINEEIEFTESDGTLFLDDDNIAKLESIEENLLPRYTKKADKIKKEKISMRIHNKPNLPLPQQGFTLISETAEMLKDTIKLFELEFYYREGDKSFVEVRNNELQTIKASRLVSITEDVVVPVSQKIVKSEDGTINITESKKSMSETHAKLIMDSNAFLNDIPKIDKYLPCLMPFVKDGELILPELRYNKDLKLYVNPESPKIEDNLTLEEAKDIINSIYTDFCFKTEDDRTKAISSLITPFLRGLYSRWNCRTPIYFHRANRERAGKDYLALLRLILYSGYGIERPAISTGRGSDNNDELRKSITSTFRTGSLFFHSSNNRGMLDNVILEQISTAEIWEDRILGKSEQARFDNDLELSLSGNTGITFTPDLANRSIIIDLFLAEENANDRTFANPDLHGFVSKNRAKIISAIYTLVKNWFDNGSPKGTKPFSSYPEWARVCGGVMESAGYDNPCMSGSDEGSLDETTFSLKELYLRGKDKFDEHYVNMGQIRSFLMESDNDDVFYWLVDDKSSNIKFAKFIRNQLGRVLGGIMMVVDDKTTRSTRQKFKFKVVDELEYSKNVKEVSTLMNKEIKNLILDEVTGDKKNG
jgi:hypothetical protein